MRASMSPEFTVYSTARASQVRAEDAQGNQQLHETMQALHQRSVKNVGHFERGGEGTSLCWVVKGGQGELPVMVTLQLNLGR